MARISETAVESVIEDVQRLSAEVRTLSLDSLAPGTRQRLSESFAQLSTGMQEMGVLARYVDAEESLRSSAPRRRGPPREPSVWGPRPPARDVEAAGAAMQARHFAERDQLAAESLTRSQVAALLTVSEPAVTGYLTDDRKRCLLGFKVGNRWAIPRWQLDAGTEKGFLPGLARLGRVFPGGIVELSRWAQRPHPDLGGRTPRDALADGDVDAVLDRAASITAAGW